MKIHILPPEEARKIAAGEVIDRPCALVREFMDNAVDAGATLIEVSVEEGGIARTEVSDNGEGMSREDLELCCLAHATSKIRTLSDLDTAQTLGFRGEALAAAASVSRLEILTSRGGEAWKLETGPGLQPHLEQSRRTQGTSVRALGLFDALPARRRFLKREGSEAAACLAVFSDKALAFPELGFRFFQDGKLRAYYPSDSNPRDHSLKERFGKTVLADGEEKFLHEIGALGKGYRVTIVFGGPELYRTDRRQQFVFANRRRIQDYSLLQALEYGTRGWFPNGTHPAGAVFIDIDPALADFNIHPAKKEVRFADIGAIHHSITEALENFRRSSYTGFTAEKIQGENEMFPGYTGTLASSAIDSAETPPLFRADLGNIRNSDSPLIDRTDNNETQNINLLGRLFNLFILVESKDRFFIIDQHAAHERILYNNFIAKKIPQQELLVTIPFSAESEEDNNFLAGRKKDLADLGIEIEQESGVWHIRALPAGWRLTDTETVREILNLKTAGKNMAEQWAATLSCHAAVKDGNYLDDETALALAKEALRLEDPHCPHGRPIWVEITREDLLRAVRRI